MIDSNSLTITENGAISVWAVMNGKITQVKIQDGIFVVRPDSPVDPIKAAKDFMLAYDIGKTALIRKVTTAVAKDQDKRLLDKPKVILEKELAARVNNIPVYKDYVCGFYKKFPNTFNSKDVMHYLSDKYDSSVSQTIMNKARAYIKYMRQEDLIEQVEGKGKTGRVYKFKHAPFGATLPAQASFDSEEVKQRKLLELETIRDQ